MPEPMRFGCRCQIAHPTSAWREAGGASGEHGGLGPGVVLVSVGMLFVCTVQDGSHWPYVAVVQRSTACVARVPSLGNLIFYWI